MIPWNKLPKDIQKSLLVMIVLSGGATSSACCPIVCDPAPPPPTSPRVTPSMTPMICDPPPPPALTRTPSSLGTLTPMICDPAPPPASSRTPIGIGTITPMICDPPPPPSATIAGRPTETPAALRHFRMISLHTTGGLSLTGESVRGTVRDTSGDPIDQVKVSVQEGKTHVVTFSGSDGEFILGLPGPGSFLVTVGEDRSSAISISIQTNELATMEWQETSSDPASSLPLAEIRTVDIEYGSDMEFNAVSSWQDAEYRWTVSGGRIAGSGDTIVWDPPEAPGRYLLQVVADWGRTGLAVDSIVLLVREDGSKHIL